MGTQQLLLIILGVIIVGVAVALGVTIFGSNADQANKDAVTQDCLRLAAAAQGYYRKPSFFGGGNNSFNNITVEALGMEDNGNGEAENLNGIYSVDGSAGVSCEIVGTSATLAGASVTITVGPATITDPVMAGW